MEDNPSEEAESLRNDPHHTLLPSPIAALISLGTATSSLSLRVASFFGSAAINTAKYGTLTGLELGRSTLEAILTRAGQDVVETSAGQLGRTAAETALSNALSTLHYAITNSSFLVSAGFQIGSTSMNASMGIAQSLLNLLDAVFGDTDTSRAIATIITIIQKEFAGKEGITPDDVKLNTRDIVTGSISFVLLQRWSREKTQEKMEVDGVEQPILDIVVLAQDDPTSALALRDTPSPEASPRTTRPPSRLTSTRPASFIAANGGGKPFDAISYNDGASFLSHPPQQQSLISEGAFRQSLLAQLQPGSSVRVTSTTTTTHIITVEIDGDATSYVQPPPGYELIAAEAALSLGEDGQKLVFRTRDEQKQVGDFEIGPSRSDDIFGEPGPELTEQSHYLMPPDAMEVDHFEPITANQKRRRSTRDPRMEDYNRFNPNQTASPGTEKKHSIRKALKGRTSYRNLLDFWNGGPSRTPRLVTTNDRRHSSSHEIPSPVPYAISPTLPDSTSLISGPQASHSRRTHRRGSSSIFTVESTELVRHGVWNDDPSTRPLEITRSGTLPGQYPSGSFARNANRFIRFASAAYGKSFLRFTGSIMIDEAQGQIPGNDELTEHINFSNYTGLPAATVLLSSFVDPQGGPNAAGQAETGLPLIHFISLDHDSKAVVIAFRGTLGFEDVLTDLSASYDVLDWQGKQYKVHQGILASARRLLTLHQGRTMSTIRAALEEFPDYGLVLCGHSLGGGVAAVLGTLLSQRNTVNSGSAFVTKSEPTTPLLTSGSNSSRDVPTLLPAGRPVHVYAYGPAATMSPDLQLDTRGLVTTIINNMDYIPYLSLGTLRDMHSIACAFKKDSGGAKAEVRKRVWQGLQDVFRDRTGLSAFGGQWWEGDQPEADHWPWATLQSVRSGMTAEKMVPPGEVFIIKGEPVLQRYAFVHDPTDDKRHDSKGDSMSFRPATHFTVTHVADVAQRFGEIRFGSSMFADHLPARYERMLETLERGI